MKKLNRKAFTLIELLAVIVVLAIIMIIATQSVSKAIEKSRLSSFESSYKMIVKQVKSKIMEKELDNSIAIACTGDCYDKYGISSDDYDLQIINDSNTYLINLVGKGKFKNIALSSISDEFPSEAEINGSSILVGINSQGKEVTLNEEQKGKLETVEERSSRQQAEQEERERSSSIAASQLAEKIAAFNYNTKIIDDLNLTSINIEYSGNDGFYTSFCDTSKAVKSYRYDKNSSPELRPTLLLLKNGDENGNTAEDYINYIKNKSNYKYPFETSCYTKNYGYIIRCVDNEGNFINIKQDKTRCIGFD